MAHSKECEPIRRLLCDGWFLCWIPPERGHGTLSIYRRVGRPFFLGKWDTAPMTFTERLALAQWKRETG